MAAFGLIIAVFGLLIIANPPLLSLLVGLALIFLGSSLILVSTAFRKGNKNSIRFGDYEIFRNKYKK